MARSTLPADQFARVTLGFAILLAFLGAGEWIALGYGLPLPGNVLGMVLLTAALASEVIKLEWVEAAADALLSRLGLFFVAPGVGVMLYADLIRREWLPLTAALLFGTYITMAATAGMARLLTRRQGGSR